MVVGALFTAQHRLPVLALSLRRTYVPCHALELIVAVLMLPRPYAVHVRQTHSRQWHKMRDKCCPSRRINF